MDVDEPIQRAGSEAGAGSGAVTTALEGGPARGFVCYSRSLGFEKLPCILQVLGAGNLEGLTGQFGHSGVGESGEETGSHSSLRRGRPEEGGCLSHGADRGSEEMGNCEELLAGGRIVGYF